MAGVFVWAQQQTHDGEDQPQQQRLLRADAEEGVGALRLHPGLVVGVVGAADLEREAAGVGAVAGDGGGEGLLAPPDQVEAVCGRVREGCLCILLCGVGCLPSRLPLMTQGAAI